MRAGTLTLVLTIALGGLPRAQDAALQRYSAIVDRYRSQPDRGREETMALASEEVGAMAGGAAAGESGWMPAQLQAAMLMHLEAALLLNKQRDERAWAHISAGQKLGETLGRDRNQAWFVHRWYTLVTHLFHDDPRLTPIRRTWRAFAWNAAIDAFEAGLRFEYQTLTPERLVPGLNVRTYDSSELRSALANFQRAADAGILVATLHAARLRMLHGEDAAARSSFEKAAIAPTPSTRYVAHLFLGAMDERGGRVTSAENHYRAASSVFPYAQSGRVALGSLLARNGRGTEAATVIARIPPADRNTVAFDPWWLYLPTSPFEPADTMTAMYAEVQK